MMASDTMDPAPQKSASDTSESTDEENWRLKACDLLEKYIFEIKVHNEELATETAALTSCIFDGLNDLIKLSGRTNRNVVDQDKLMEYLCEISELHSDLEFEHHGSDLCLPPISRTTLPLDHGDSSGKPGQPYSVDSEDVESPASYTNMRRRLSPVPVKSRKIQEGQPSHHSYSRPKPEPVPSISQSHKRLAHTEEQEDSESDLIRTAFRLFAKHIGPSLKREHRSIFNTPPTQAWLADQLLTRWDALDPCERQNWLRRIQTA